MSSAEATSQSSREYLMNVAEQLMAARGYHRTSIADIRRASGLPVGSIYHHFKSKSGLLAAVIERGSRRFFANLPRAVDISGSSEETMRAYWSAAAATIAEHISYFQLEADIVWHGAADPELAAVVATATDYARDQLVAVVEPFARESGVVDPRALAVELALTSVTFVRGAVIESGGDAAYLERKIGALYRMLRADIVVQGADRGARQ
ncbi:TetR/AcrR family transcriptional regulator [Rhodococcus ruber]|uniref:TetR/AcrR family transcriptional regulator n=1 Tax=Rhodococcus ruber TaxID=1830 RepID=UPI00265DB06B|nr:TetR/AcrR family transcriptional regulator [Rhodococcus ruber]MDO1477055.1 TetR/AcrR family transcriptional regulator [Rhodococcus ruber]